QFPTQTHRLIVGNAKNWAYTTMLILRNHYEQTLDTEVDKLTKMSTHDWRDPFQIAKAWARKYLGRRLSNDTIDHAEATLVARLPPPTHPLVDFSVATTDTPHRGNATQALCLASRGAHSETTTAQVHIRLHTSTHTTDTQTTDTQTYTPQQPVRPHIHTEETKTVATMTDQASDWSPFRQEERENSPTLTHTTPPPPMVTHTDVGPPPKPQRPKRASTQLTTPNPCVVTENDSILDLTIEELEEHIGSEAGTHTYPPEFHSRYTTLTPRRITRLQSAIQSQLKLSDIPATTLTNSPQSQAPSTSQTPTRRPTRHLQTTKKLQDWGLSVGKKWLIMGDSNVSRGQHVKGTTIKQLQSAVRAATNRFPHAEIWIPEINYDRTLPHREQSNLLSLNAHILRNYKYIPELPMDTFETEDDKVHWTRGTAARMLEHWSCAYRRGTKMSLFWPKISNSEPQLALLSKGLSFIPTMGINKNQLQQIRWDLQQYHRRLKLAIHYKNTPDSQPLPFTPKSDWTPPNNTLPTELITLIERDIKSFQSTSRFIQERHNLTIDEAVALRELSRNKQIVIKPADKGNVVVIMDRQQYLWEGYRQLHDQNYYSVLQSPIYPDTIPMVEKIVQSLHDKRFINAKQKTYLLGDQEPRARLFYMLPKIHKDPAKWSKPYEIPPGRPIVSDCNNTYDFVEKTKQLRIPLDAILFTMDIDSLYTNIDIQEGIQAVKNVFQKYPDRRRPDRELLQLLEINLRRNDFEFNGEYFLQTKGTAMGKKFAPAYKPLHYYRYLDDIWGLWTHSGPDFELFLATLNNHNSSIQLKSTTNNRSIDFLDTTTFKGKNFTQTNQLDIKVFFKDTDTHALLFKTSFHPKHTFAGLVKSQLLRFHRICTQEEDFTQATKTLFSALRKRGYARSFLRKSFKTFLDLKPRLDTKILPLVTKYSSFSVKFIRAIKHNYQNLIEAANLLQGHRLIEAFRKNKFFQQQTWVQNKYNNSVFLTYQRGSPRTKNCVYLITCKECSLQYVGETGNTLLIRFTQHRHNILKNKESHTPLVRHFLLLTRPTKEE
ncbi:hypothetical protein Q8A73_007302, partial [Channa argus]